MLHRAHILGNVSQEVRRRSRNDPDHPVNGQKVNERAARSAPLPIDPPSSTETQAFRSPFPQGKAFGLSPRQRSAFPGGKGDREERAVDEGSFRLTLAFQLRNTNVTSCTHTGKCLAGAVFRCWLIAVPRLSRRGRRTPRNLHAFLVVLAALASLAWRAS